MLIDVRLRRPMEIEVGWMADVMLALGRRDISLEVTKCVQ